MNTDMVDMRGLMREVRANESDPELVRMYRNAAGEILSTAATAGEYVYDPDFLELDGEARDAYLNEQVDGLAAALRRAAIAWAIFDSDLVAEWCARRSSGARLADD